MLMRNSRELLGRPRIPTPAVARSAMPASALAAALLFCLLLSPGAAKAGRNDDDSDGGRYCSDTARLAFNACTNEIMDDNALARAICTNVSDSGDRRDCFAEARESLQEGTGLCRAQLAARRDVCRDLGEDRYDPDFDPDSFEDDFTSLPQLNPYFPLVPGNTWEFQGAGEKIVVTVLSDTKKIEGVTCIVSNDVVSVNGNPVEDTNDWFAQAKNGNVHYCGEEVKDFETFPDDNPPIPELVAIDGSFKAGRDGDKPGIFFFASPEKGDVYRQEFSLGNAEDVAKVLVTDYDFGDYPTLDTLVPKPLADLLCANDCVVTREYTPVEPGAFALKYYSSGIGVFLEVTPDSGEVVRLVSCNLNPADPRCATLPAP